MARRGSFGTFNAGSSNLSATIQALVRQQMAAEEQTLMNAFYNGTTFNGSVPTMQTVIEFYNRVANLSGIEQGSSDWDALTQKIGAANNYDIKRDYSALINEFESSNGANYEELSSFLKGRAQDSTDPQDSETYQNATGDINKAYIGYKGEALGRGEITAADYRSLTTNILDQMDPADPKRYETLVNSYTYEWNAEKTKWDNRLTAGTVNASQYANWAKGFQNSLVSAGISTDSTLYTAAVAAQAIAKNRGGGGAGSTVKTRIDGTLKEIDDVVDIALSLNTGSKPRSVSEIYASGKDSLTALTNDPALILNLGAELDANPNGFPALAELGITDSASLNTYFQDRLDSGRADANLLVSSGGPDYTESWFTTSDAVGGLSELAKFDFQSTKWLKDVAAAQGNIAKIEQLNNEWKNYLSGGESKYGKLNGDNLPPQFISLAQNELDAMDGSSDGSKPTLSGTVNADLPLNFTTVRENKAQINAMKSGNGYQQWNEVDQEFVFVEGQPTGGAATGSYQFVEFERINGKIVPYVTSIKGVKVMDSTGQTQLGWRFDRQNGSPPIVSNLKGQLIEVSGTGLSGNNNSGFSLPEGGTFKVSSDKIPLYDPIGLATKTLIPVGPNARNELAIIRAGRTELTVSPDDLREASTLVGNVLPALGRDRMEGGNIAASLNADANEIQTTQIKNSESGGTPKSKAEIARLAGNTDLEKAWLFIDANKDKLEIVNGGYRWKAGTAEANQPRSDALGQAAALGAAGFAAGGFTGIGAIPAAIGAGVVGFAQGLAQGKQSPLDTISDINKTILNQDPSMKSQRESFYYSQPFVSPNAGGSNSNVGDRFFRNFKAPAIPTSTGPRPSIPTVTSVRPSIPTVTRPGPSIPVAPVPFVAPMTQKYGAGSPFATTPIVQNQSTARLGGK